MRNFERDKLTYLKVNFKTTLIHFQIFTNIRDGKVHHPTEIILFLPSEKPNELWIFKNLYRM